MIRNQSNIMGNCVNLTKNCIKCYKMLFYKARAGRRYLVVLAAHQALQHHDATEAKENQATGPTSTQRLKHPTIQRETNQSN